VCFILASSRVTPSPRISTPGKTAWWLNGWRRDVRSPSLSPADRGAMRCIYSDMASSNRSPPAPRLVAQIHRKSGAPANARMGSGPVCHTAQEWWLPVQAVAVTASMTASCWTSITSNRVTRTWGWRSAIYRSCAATVRLGVKAATRARAPHADDSLAASWPSLPALTSNLDFRLPHLLSLTVSQAVEKCHFPKKINRLATCAQKY